MRTGNIYTLLEALSNHLQQKQNDNASVVTEQVRMVLPSCMDSRVIEYLEMHSDVKNRLLISYLNDCRYLLNLLACAQQEFISEEYQKMARLSNDLFHVADLLQTEDLFLEFKTVLTNVMKQHRSFRTGFRNTYFSLSSKTGMPHSTSFLTPEPV